MLLLFPYSKLLDNIDRVEVQNGYHILHYCHIKVKEHGILSFAQAYMSSGPYVPRHTIMSLCFVFCVLFLSRVELTLNVWLRYSFQFVS